MSKKMQTAEEHHEELVKGLYDQMKPILDDYVKMAKSKGLPGDEALKFCEDFLKKNP